jgi:DNA polymerase III subunit epsilon
VLRGSQSTKESESIFSYPVAAKRGHDLSDVPIVAVDFETTGLNASFDRVVEVAVVRIGRTGEIESEWSSLIDPDRDVGPTFIHHVTNDMVRGAPRFHEIVGAILQHLDGALVASHYAEFEAAFLRAELKRCGLSLPAMPALCTYETAQAMLDCPNYRLQTACDRAQVGIAHTGGALGDARLKAHLAAHFVRGDSLGLAWAIAPQTFAPMGCSAKPRTRVTNLRKGEVGWMANVLARLPVSASEADATEAAVYLDALAVSLGDGKLTGPEAKQLASLAGEAGLGAAQVAELNLRFLAGMRASAFADGVLTPEEFRQLRNAAALLGLSGYFEDLAAQVDTSASSRGLGPTTASGESAGIAQPVVASSGQAAASVLATGSAKGQLPPPAHPGGWYPDQRQRAEYRWYDGVQWTAFIAIRGRTSHDELWPN